MKAAVIGVGYLGRFHAQKYATIATVDLIGVCDNNKAQADIVAAELNVAAYYDYNELADKVDLVSIAVPTKLHFKLAKFFLSKGISVLLEKPMTETIAEADCLIKIAKQQQLVLQIGHLERFNPALLALSKIIHRPMFIDAHRLAPFNLRGADVNVMLDLMIHDIDIIQSLLNSPINKIDPIGSKVLTNEVDICNARLAFENGCIANVNASRVSNKTERKMRIFQHNKYITVDFQEKTLAVYYKNASKNKTPNQASIQSNISSFEQTDALADEIIAFISSVQQKTEPVVSGEMGREALLTVLTIGDKIKENQ